MRKVRLLIPDKNYVVNFSAEDGEMTVSRSGRWMTLDEALEIIRSFSTCTESIIFEYERADGTDERVNLSVDRWILEYE